MTLKIKVKNLRAVEKAEIDLSGISILSGLNGSGKSTIAKMTFDFFDVVIRYNEIVDYLYLTEKISPLGRLLFEATNYMTGVVPKPILQATALQFFPFFAGDSNLATFEQMKKGLDFFSKMLEQVPPVLNAKQESQVKKMKRLFLSVVGVNEDFSLKEIVPSIVQYIEKSLSEASIKKATRTAGVFQKKWKMDFGSGLNPNVFNIFDENLPILDTENDVVLTKNSLNRVLYVDSPMSLGEDQSMRRHWRYLNKILKRERVKESFDYADSVHLGLLKGSSQWQKDFNSEKFVYRSPNGEEYDLLECATGLKSFSILQMLYQNGCIDSGTLIILDEPETHLHPQWIPEYARLVVRLHKNVGVKFLIASHSPDMIRAIKYVSEYELIDEMGSVCFYIANANVHNPYKYSYEKVGLDISSIFKSFNVSLEKIDQYSGQL